MSEPSNQEPLDDLQLDLAATVARLRQVAREGYDAIPDVAERLWTCDLPRLERHLSADAMAAVLDAEVPR